MQQKADTELDIDDVRQVMRGDREAFGRLYDRHAKSVRAVVAAVSGDFGGVEDMTQETFLRAYRRCDSLQSTENFRQWIQGIARNVARERKRKLGSERVAEIEPAADLSEASPESTVTRDEQSRLVMAAVAELPERESMVVHAYYFNGQCGDAAAAAIGISRSGFYATLQRALARLRGKLNAAN